MSKKIDRIEKKIRKDEKKWWFSKRLAIMAQKLEAPAVLIAAGAFGAEALFSWTGYSGVGMLVYAAMKAGIGAGLGLGIASGVEALAYIEQDRARLRLEDHREEHKVLLLEGLVEAVEDDTE